MGLKKPFLENVQDGVAIKKNLKEIMI